MDYSPGLRGVVAGETAISTVGMEGTSLRYRGYDAIELTKNSTYEAVASLVINGSLDEADYKKSFSKYLSSYPKNHRDKTHKRRKGEKEFFKISIFLTLKLEGEKEKKSFSTYLSSYP